MYILNVINRFKYQGFITSDFTPLMERGTGGYRLYTDIGSRDL